MTERHARTLDLPGWATPSTVKALAKRPGSWGWLHIGIGSKMRDVLGYDGNDRLWVRGDAALMPVKNGVHISNLALLAWHEAGIGLYLPREAYGNLARVDPEDPHGPGVEAFSPIALVFKDLPNFAC